MKYLLGLFIINKFIASTVVLLIERSKMLPSVRIQLTHIKACLHTWNCLSILEEGTVGCSVPLRYEVLTFYSYCERKKS